ncbi:MAG: group I truncated hemoglobin [Saccharospirillum sp.]|jgi:hemoglobin
MKTLLIVILAAMLAACANNPTNRVISGDATLYERMGEREGITTVVDNLLYELGDNTLLLPFFAETNIERFREKLIEQLCNVSDGPCEYTGDSMVDTHAGMEMDDRHFNALVTDLITAMTDADIPVGAQNDLLARLAPMHDEVVNARRYQDDESLTPRF